MLCAVAVAHLFEESYVDSLADKYRDLLCLREEFEYGNLIFNIAALRRSLGMDDVSQLNQSCMLLANAEHLEAAPVYPTSHRHIGLVCDDGACDEWQYCIPLLRTRSPMETCLRVDENRDESPGLEELLNELATGFAAIERTLLPMLLLYRDSLIANSSARIKIGCNSPDVSCKL